MAHVRDTVLQNVVCCHIAHVNYCNTLARQGRAIASARRRRNGGGANAARRDASGTGWSDLEVSAPIDHSSRVSRLAAEPCTWLYPQLTRQGLQIHAIQLLHGLEKALFGRRNTSVGFQFGPHELKCRNHVCGLKEPILSRRDVFDELRSRANRLESLAQQGEDVGLLVVVVDLELVVGIEFFELGCQECADLPKQRGMRIFIIQV